MGIKQSTFINPNQLRLFTQPATSTVIDKLRNDISEIERLIGSESVWLTRTLSDVLAQWDELVERFVAPVDEELAVAKATGAGRDKLELIRQRQAIYLQLITGSYSDRMIHFEQRVIARAKALGVDQEDLTAINELVCEFFQRPVVEELSLTLLECIERLTNELLIDCEKD